MKGRSQNEYNEASITLDTLAANTAISSELRGIKSQGIKIKKFKYAVTIYGKTTNEGPVAVGIACQDLTDSQIAECINAQPTDFQDPGSSEQGNRKVFVLEVLAYNGTAMDASLTKWKEAKDFPSWVVEEHEDIRFFAYNFGAQLTTGCIARIVCWMNYRWLHD